MNQNLSAAKLYSVADAARLLGSVSPWTLRKHIANGAIRVTRIGRRVLLPVEEIERIREVGLPSLRTQVVNKPNVTISPKSFKEEEELCLTK